MFFKHSKYFRNALVRANYYDKNIDMDMRYLKKFFVNLLFYGEYELCDDEFYYEKYYYSFDV